LLSFQCRHWRTPSSAHTYRLLVVKEPVPPSLLLCGESAKRCVCLSFRYYLDSSDC